jgi:hypothetical protein
MNTTNSFSVALGAAYWLLAALFVRAFGSFFFTGNTPGLLVLYAASVPGTWLLIQNARWLGRLAPAEVLDAVVVMTWTAAVLDGWPSPFSDGSTGLPRRSSCGGPPGFCGAPAGDWA